MKHLRLRATGLHGLLFALAVGTGFGLAANGAEAQEYPTKPIRLIVPYAPGGGGDLVGRAINEELGRILGQPVLIANHAGGSTLVGTELLARAKPDGYTLLLTNNAFVKNPILQESMPFKTPDDFAPVARLMTYPFVLGVNAKLGISSLKDLVEHAKKNEKPLTSGTTGLTSGTHITTVLLNQLAGINIQSVPFSGGGPVITALVGGHIDMAFAARSLLVPFAESGDIKIVGTTGLKPIGSPPIQPFADQGVPGYKYELWWGVLAPKGTPDAIVQKVNAALKQAMASEEAQKRLASIEGDINVTSPAEYGDFIRSEIARWTAILKPTESKK
ncbi:MAG: tripartite tricarboxylate transporter substrate binding protein [Microvirga sp.]|jgi:tripartite-type tricarboxylate transporter receptor subunit TctC|nr:tripartite tricarboxylate transporter substrate binding protein [Microvirga sp.]